MRLQLLVQTGLCETPVKRQQSLSSRESTPFRVYAVPKNLLPFHLLHSIEHAVVLRRIVQNRACAGKVKGW